MASKEDDNMDKALEKNDLTTGSIPKKLFSFFVPIALGTIFQQLYNTADAFIVSKYLGTMALAAVGGSAATINMWAVNVFCSLAGGASVIIAQLRGAKDAEGVSISTHTAICFSGICGIVLGVLGFLFTPQLLVLMKTPDVTMADSIAYLKYLCLGIPFTMIYNMGSGIMRATGDSRRPFIYLVVCCLTNIVLDILFIEGFSMGVEGAAIATSLSQCISMVLVVISMSRTKDMHRLSFRKLRIDFKMLKKTLQIGIPSSANSILNAVTNIMIQVGVNVLGAVAVAGWSIGGKINGYYWGLASAMYMSTSNFIGQNYGAGQSERMKKSVKTGLLLFNGITVGIMLFIFIFGKMFINSFTDDYAVREMTWRILLLFLPVFLPWTTMHIFSGTLLGMGDVWGQMLISGVAVSLFRIIWLKTVFVRYSNIDILSISYLLSCVVALAILLPYYFTKSRKKMENFKPLN